MISKVLYWWCPSVVPECSCCVCLRSFVLLHTRTFHQEDPMLARTMTAGCGLALGLLAACREGTQSSTRGGECLCVPACARGCQAGRHQTQSCKCSECGGSRSPEWRGVASGWGTQRGAMEEVAHDWILERRGVSTSSSVLPGSQCVGDQAWALLPPPFTHV